MPSYRLTLRERAWSGHRVVRTIGPLCGVDVASLRRALRHLHPNRATSAIDVVGGRWVTLTNDEFERRLDLLVVSAPAEPGRAPDVLAQTLMALDLGDRPVVFAVCCGHVGMKANHALGDGTTLNGLLATVVAMATGLPSARQPHGVRAPLLRATTSFYVRNPRQVIRMLSDAWHLGFRRARASDDAVSPRRGDADWRPDPTFAYASTADGAMARVRRQRSGRLRASVSSIVTAAIASALHDAGIHISLTELCVNVDVRRYVRHGHVAGNFVVGQRILADDVRDPSSVDRAVRGVLTSGRALAAMAVGDMRALRPARTPEFELGAPGRLTVSHLGGRGDLAGLPWAAPPGNQRLCVVNQPDGRNGLTVTTAEIGGTLHLTAGFHASTYSPQAVAQALAAACASLNAFDLALVGASGSAEA